MKEGGRWLERLREQGKKLGKFRYPLLILLLGLILLLLPGRGESEEIQQTGTAEPVTVTADDRSAEERRLAELLSRVEGAGKVEVMLSVRLGEEICYQTDTRTERDESGNEQHEETTVLVRSGSSTESPLVRQRSAPVYQGAVILCQGAEDPGVKLALVEAVSDLTGLSTDRITVIKMK